MDRNFGAGGQDGSLMIDMVHFKDFQMDTTTWQATFGAGFTLGALDKELHKHGKRAMAHGTCPGVGTGGHLTIVSCSWELGVIMMRGLTYCC